MSSPWRRREVARQRELQEALEQQEAFRKANLTVYERIEEIDSMRDVKDFLHWMTDRLDLRD